MGSTGPLRLLLDSADQAAWREWLGSGLFHGITTNPTLLGRAGMACEFSRLEDLARAALDLGAHEIQLQAWGSTAGALADCGRQLAAPGPDRILVKLPMTRSGVDAAKRLLDEHLRVTFTACYEVSQVVMAAALGVDYIAAYLGRLNDAGRDGFAEVAAMQCALDKLGSSTRLLVASLREAADLGRLATLGLRTFTLSPAVAAAVFANADTDAAVAQFERDAAGT